MPRVVGRHLEKGRVKGVARWCDRLACREDEVKRHVSCQTVPSVSRVCPVYPGWDYSTHVAMLLGYMGSFSLVDENGLWITGNGKKPRRKGEPAPLCRVWICTGGWSFLRCEAGGNAGRLPSGLYLQGISKQEDRIQERTRGKGKKGGCLNWG